jgi:tetratricopeptide (TPR) repeat protein
MAGSLWIVSLSFVMTRLIILVSDSLMIARRALCIFLILLFINDTRAQSDTLWADGKRTVLFVGLELIDLEGTLTQWPYYSSFDGALIEDLRKVIRYPECAFAHSLTGDVDVQFRVEMDGSISTVKVTYGNSACLNDAALTAVRLLPDFTRPATRDGRSVAAKMKLTLSFQMMGIETGNDEHSNFVRLCNKGANELRAARYDAAVEAYSAAIAVNDRWMINYFGRGIGHYGAGRYKEALSDFNHVAKSLSRIPVEVYFNRGLTRHKLGDLEGAEFDFDQVLVLVPNNADALIQRGKVRGEAGNASGGAADIQKVIGMNDRNASAHFELGLVNLSAGHLNLALGDFTRAITIEPEEPTYFLARGRCKMAMQDQLGACADWNRAKELGSTDIYVFLLEHCR